MCHTKIVVTITTHILCSVTFLSFFFFFFFLKFSSYYIMWKNTAEPDRPQITVWHIRISCWIPNTTNTHSEYVLLIACPLHQWSRKRSSMLRYSTLAVLLDFSSGAVDVSVLLECDATSLGDPCRTVLHLKKTEILLNTCRSLYGRDSAHKT